MNFDLLTQQARKQGIPLFLPQDYPPGRDFQSSPSVDFGQYLVRVPRLVLQPEDQDQLRSCVGMLAECAIPYCTRGAGHSSGGQTLIENGAVLDCRRLDRIVSDDDASITVEGGIWWRTVTESLLARGRRPVVLTDNLRTTVAGTLAVGGFGDTSHLYGLQIHHVRRLKILTPDGVFHECEPGSPLFQYSLAGRGQLGIISQATLETIRRPSTLMARFAEWNSLDDFVEDALRSIEGSACEFLRARLYYLPDSPGRNRVRAVAGHFLEQPPAPDSPFRRCARLGPDSSIDLFSHPLRDPSDLWAHGSPAIEFILPLPQGLDVWKRLNGGLIACGLSPFFPNGSSVMVLNGNRTLPLAPLPDSNHCLLMAVRPVMRLGAIQQYLPLLQRLGYEALEAGGKIYSMSIQVDHPEFLQRQYEGALPEFLRLKKKLDPSSLLNPGLMQEFQF